MKQSNIQYFSLLQISRMYDIPKKTLATRCLVMGIEKTNVGTAQPMYMLNPDQVNMITLKDSLYKAPKPITIYETVYIEVIHSRLNYTPLNQLQRWKQKIKTFINIGFKTQEPHKK